MKIKRQPRIIRKKLGRPKGSKNKVKRPGRPLGSKDVGPRANMTPALPDRKGIPDIVRSENCITVQFLDSLTFGQAWEYLRRRTRVSMGEFLEWIKYQYGGLR